MSTGTTYNASSGREASKARRRAMVLGKASLPAASERVRSGFREAAMPKDTPAAAPVVSEVATAPVAEPAAESATPVAAAPAAPESPVAAGQQGRRAAMERRRRLIQGKASLTQAAAADAPAPTPAAAPLANVTSDSEGRKAARMRRVMQSRFGRGDTPASGPSRPPRKGEINFPEKVPTVATTGDASVTGISFSRGAVTGTEPGRDKPLTGTQYIGPGEGGFRAGGPGKVGHSRTAGGGVVSGTMVRSRTRITGDEANESITITGKADQTMAEDLSAREDSVVAVSAQFQRQSQPHGQSVFGNNLGRSARAVGSRSRDMEPVTEMTNGGRPVSGTAVGRSTRVTGDEPGSERSLTGTQYLAPAQAQGVEGSRPDPVTASKVTESRTWGGQSVTGPQFEHNERVTGSEPGSCATMTGTPYYGATGAYGWCETEQADCEAARRGPQTPRRVTGDVPLHDPNRVSGTGRGGDRDIGGTPYFVGEESRREDEADAIQNSINGFSVRSPQRTAHLDARGGEAESRGITGTFSQGEGKVTGNVEFQHRNLTGGGHKPGRASLTGEGSTSGPQITGSAWAEDSRVTGTEGYIASGRNSTERSGSDHGFAGATRFKNNITREDQRSAVTGAVGWTPKSGAAVTLSGGAAG